MHYDYNHVYRLANALLKDINYFYEGGKHADNVITKEEGYIESL